MLKKEKFALCIGFCLLFMGCGPTKEKKSLVEVKRETLDTLVLDSKNCGLDLNRFHVYKNKNENLRLGKLNIKLSIADLSVNGSATYAIDNGWMIYDDKAFTISCSLKTAQVVLPVLDSSKQLKFATPNYLLSKKSDYLIFEYNGNFYPREQSPTATLFLNTGDTTGAIPDVEHRFAFGKDKKMKGVETDFYVNGLNWNLFEPENKNEVVKDSIIATLKLSFK